ncbi:HipA family kinase [Frischella perrara]|uniref:HipA family kinase n=1 Tax=Frischella perrara TaxID=1267021 RepID=UPI0023F3A1EB|nr:HipA family kinase [Frischella perrara]
MTDNMVKVGRIISDSEPIEDGINNSFRCIACCDNEEYPVVAKYIKGIEILKELICAILGRLINLPIPEPILLLDQNDVFCFGSLDVGYPNLYHRLNIQDPYYIEFHSIIKNWSALESASFFDEFIINPDRHSGNLLYNGKDIAMIDHGLSMQLDKFKPDYDEDWNNILFNHLLCKFTELSCEHKLDKIALCNRLTIWCEEIEEINNNNLIAKAINKIPIAHKSKNELLYFLTSRSEFIQKIINNRINPNQMDFVNV